MKGHSAQLVTPPTCLIGALLLCGFALPFGGCGDGRGNGQQAGGPARAAEAEPLDISITVELGKDVGQNLGSLFEAVDGDGRVLFGAGFAGACSTYMRDNHYVLQFFYRDRNEDARFNSIGRPHKERFRPRLVTFGDDLLECSYRRGFDGKQWTDAGALQAGILNFQYVNNKPLLFTVGKCARAEYDGEVILTAPNAYGTYYFGQRVFLSTLGRVYCWRWDPRQGGTAEPADPPFAPLGSPEDYVLAFGQYGGRLLCATGHGGIYAYEAGRWQEIYKSRNGQFYTMLNYHDKLLLGHYPSGMLYEYDGVAVRRLDNFPPRPPGASPLAREAQTLAIYRGDLFVGAWPWGELWRFNADTSAWTFRRTFERPPITSVEVPYENEMLQAIASGRTRLDYNIWGQRISQLVNYKDTLVIGTSNKRGNLFVREKYPFLTEKELRQYGRVHQLRMNSSISAQARWKITPTVFRFCFDEAAMTMYQDGEILYAIRHRASCSPPPAVKSVRLGRGVFGPFSGKIVSSKGADDGEQGR